MSLKIKNARYGITSGGMACGPIFGHVIAEVELVDTETGETCFYTDEEVEGTINIYKTDESVLDTLLSEPMEEEFWNKMEQKEVLSYVGYEEFYFDVGFRQGNFEQDQIYRYLIYLVRASEDEFERFLAHTKGKRIIDVIIPKTDVEKEIEEEREE